MIPTASDLPPIRAQTIPDIALPALVGFTIASLGTAMPDIRSDLGMDMATAGLHFTALAAGGLGIGASYARLSSRLDVRRAFVVGLFGFVGSLSFLAAGVSVAISLSAALGLGAATTLMMLTVRASLAARRGTRLASSMAVMDSSWSSGAVTAGLLIAWLLGAGVEWRVALATPVLAAIAIVSMLKDDPAVGRTTHAQLTNVEGGRLPDSYWFVWAGFLPVVAAEWSLAAWLTTFLVQDLTVPTHRAALAASCFFGAILVGRLFGVRLTRRVAPIVLFPVFAATAAAGSLTLSLATSSQAAFVGVIVTGLGISLQASLLWAAGMSMAVDHIQLGTARISLGVSGAKLVAPFTLALVAESFGLRNALRIVPIMFVLAVVLVVLGERLRAV